MRTQRGRVETLSVLLLGPAEPPVVVRRWKARAVAARGHHHQAEAGVGGQRLADHHAGLGVGVGVGQAGDAGDQLAVADQRAVGEVELVRAAPDVRAGAGDARGWCRCRRRSRRPRRRRCPGSTRPPPPASWRRRTPTGWTRCRCRRSPTPGSCRPVLARQAQVRVGRAGDGRAAAWRCRSGRSGSRPGPEPPVSVDAVQLRSIRLRADGRGAEARRLGRVDGVGRRHVRRGDSGPGSTGRTRWSRRRRRETR